MFFGFFSVMTNIPISFKLSFFMAISTLLHVVINCNTSLIYNYIYIYICDRYQSKTAKSILDTILEIQPKDSSSGTGETRESAVYRICDDMLGKLPPDYVPYEVTGRLRKMGDLQPMNIFLRQEIDRMQKVISTVRSTLHDLKLAIDGTIIMSENLRNALDSMYDAKIPRVWLAV